MNSLQTLILSRETLKKKKDKTSTKSFTAFYSTREDKKEKEKRDTAENDMANHKVLKLPSGTEVDFDLSKDLKELSNVWEGEKLDILLKSLIQHDLVGASQFVCKAKLLVLVAMTVFDVTKEEQHYVPTILVEKINGTYYMYLKPKKFDPSDNQYMGLKFEQYITSKPGKKPTPSDDVQEELYKELGALVKWNLGGHKMIVSGEIDCCDESNQLVEIKTTEEESFIEIDWHRHLEWWIRCHLLGIKTLVWGRRNRRRINSVLPIQVCSPGYCGDSFLHDQTDLYFDKGISKYQYYQRALYEFLEFVQNYAKPREESDTRPIYKISRTCKTKVFTIEQLPEGDVDVTNRFINEDLYGKLSAKDDTECKRPNAMEKPLSVNVCGNITELD